MRVHESIGEIFTVCILVIVVVVCSFKAIILGTTKTN